MMVQIAKFSIAELGNAIYKIKPGEKKTFALSKGHYPEYMCQVKRRVQTYDLVIRSSKTSMLVETFTAISITKVVTIINGYVEISR